MIKYFLILILFILDPSIMLSQIMGKISGKVIDAKNNEPIVGSIVLFDGTNFRALTDINGNFLIENIPKGYYSVTAKYIGYSSMNYDSVLIGEEIDTKLNFFLDVENISYIKKNHNYIKEGFQFWWAIKLGDHNLGIPQEINFSAKFVRDVGSNCYQFKVETLKTRYPKFYDDVKNILQQEINLQAKLKLDEDLRIKNYNFSAEDMALFLDQFEDGIITFFIPTYSLSIPFAHDSTYFFNAKKQLGRPSQEYLYIFNDKDLYFAGVRHVNPKSLEKPINFPIQIKEVRLLKDCYKRDGGILMTNTENEYRYGNEFVLLTQGEQKTLSEWVIYQGLARNQKIVEGIRPIHTGYNGISFTIVKK